MATLIRQSGKSFEQLCAKADALRDDIRRIIGEVEAGIDAASPGADDHRRRLRNIALTLDDVPIPKMMELALYGDETGGALLDMIGFALEPPMIGYIDNAAALVALYDDDVAELGRQVERQGFH